MSDWLNKVTIIAPRNATTSHTVSPSSGTVADGTLFTPTAGRLLVAVIGGAVTSTTPSGWTLPTNGDAVSGSGLYVFYKTAAGNDSLTTTHNAANYTVPVTFFEFAAGSTFGTVARATGVANGGAGPTLSGLSTTTAKWVGTAAGRSYTATGAPAATTWSAGTKIVDASAVKPSGSTDGFVTSLAEWNLDTAASRSSAATIGATHERLILSVTPPAGGGGQDLTASVADNVGITDTGAPLSVDVGDLTADNAAVTDQAAPTQDVVRTQTEPVGVTDSVTANVTGAVGATIGDPVGVSDNAATQLNASRTVGDTAAASDATATALQVDRQQADAIAATDTAAATLNRATSLNDPAGVTDTANATLTSAAASVVADNLAVTDNATSQTAADRTLSETVGVSDAVTAQLDRVVTVEDFLALTDATTPTKTGADDGRPVDNPRLTITTQQPELALTTPQPTLQLAATQPTLQLTGTP